MKKITDIYQEYKIMPNLVEHHLRVAGVAMQICDSLDIDVDREMLITACLVHDMGNIIKFKLGYFPESIETEGLEYWQQVQNDYIEKYGKDEHYATLEIVKELGLGVEVYELVACIGFLTAKETVDSQDFNKKICSYADMRTGPNGIISLEDRLLDAKNRYEQAETSSSIINRGSDYPVGTTDNLRDVFETSMRSIEKQIFEHCSIRPDEINDESVNGEMEKLREYSL